MDAFIVVHPRFTQDRAHHVNGGGGAALLVSSAAPL